MESASASKPGLPVLVISSRTPIALQISSRTVADGLAPAGHRLSGENQPRRRKNPKRQGARHRRRTSALHAATISACAGNRRPKDVTAGPRRPEGYDLVTNGGTGKHRTGCAAWR